MRVYALTSSQVPGETLDLFLTREAAETELREILEDEPDWVDVLSVAPIELPTRSLPLTPRTTKTAAGMAAKASLLKRWAIPLTASRPDATAAKHPT